MENPDTQETLDIKDRTKTKKNKKLSTKFSNTSSTRKPGVREG